MFCELRNNCNVLLCKFSVFFHPAGPETRKRQISWGTNRYEHVQSTWLQFLRWAVPALAHGIQSAWNSWSAWSHLEPRNTSGPLSCQGGCGGWICWDHCGGWICWDQRGQSDSSDSHVGFRRFGRREMLWIGERPGNDSHPDALSKILVSACRVNTATGKALDELMCKRHALFRNIRQSKKSSLFSVFCWFIPDQVDLWDVKRTQLSNVKSEFGVDLIRFDDSIRWCSEFFEFLQQRCEEFLLWLRSSTLWAVLQPMWAAFGNCVGPA